MSTFQVFVKCLYSPDLYLIYKSDNYRVSLVLVILFVVLTSISNNLQLWMDVLKVMLPLFHDQLLCSSKCLFYLESLIIATLDTSALFVTVDSIMYKLLDCVSCILVEI